MRPDARGGRGGAGRRGRRARWRERGRAAGWRSIGRNLPRGPGVTAAMADARDLAPLRVLDEHGAELPLGSLWRDRTAVIALVRHFG